MVFLAITELPYNIYAFYYSNSSGISKLCDYLQHSPEDVTAEDLRLFQLHLVNIGTTGQTINVTLTALRFLYNITLDKPEVVYLVVICCIALRAMTHYPHVHGIVLGGSLSLEGEKWISCKSGFFLPVRVLSRLFRRLYLERSREAYEHHQLMFFGECLSIEDVEPYAQWLNRHRKMEWVVYAKRHFAGPEAVLNYLARYTHRWLLLIVG
ncbi:hypothetical protein A9Q81_28360 [Gammaproteobacteria bacterium 42_54_T18]|nr:hypothetical protein A9Q81_28360 [Gammaproteobacteria bacterium 42_54_T18]